MTRRTPLSSWNLKAQGCKVRCKKCSQVFRVVLYAVSASELARTFRRNHCLQRRYASLPLALKTSSYALAGSFPTEFGELINLTHLNLEGNKLSGTPSLLILPGVVVRVYHLL